MDIAQEKKFYTPEEYLALERKAEYKSELIYGEIIAMAGSSRQHNIITGALYTEIKNRIKSKPCQVYFTDIRVAIQKTGLYTYPDIIIACGKEEFLDTHLDTLLNPTCIIEVLSDSTEKYDRGDKFLHYQSIESLQEYFLVSQNKKLVEKFKRSEKNWIYTSYSEENVEIPFDYANVSIILSEIYGNMEI